MPNKSMIAAPWVVISVLCGISVLAALQYMLLVPVLPKLPAELHASPGDVQWMVTASILAAAVGTPIFARLADMYGRRLMLFVSLWCVFAGSVLALLTENIWLLVAARAITGLSNSAIPVSIAVLREALPVDKRALGIGLVSTTGTIGVGIALPFGGWLDAAFGWRSIFVVMALLSVLFVVLVWVCVAKDTIAVAAQFDFLGAALLVIGLCAGLIGISQGSQWGWLDVKTWGLMCGAIIIGLLWYLYERKTSAPIIDLRVSNNSLVVIANVLSVAVGFTIFGNILVMTSQLQVPADAGGFGLDALAASGLLAIPAFTIMIAGPVASVLVPKIGARKILFWGGLLTLVGYGVRWLLPGDLSAIVIGSIVIQLGSAACMAAIPLIITANVPQSETASANGLNNLLRSIGSTLSSAAVAAAFALTAVSQSGVEYPTEFAFAVFFGIATACGVIILLGAIVLNYSRSDEFSELP